ncbi:MAG: ATP-dependent helicase [Phycisphaerales bacterium]
MDLLSGLNAAQREAVTHRGGPLMVLAGPGTGKTRLIVHRVAHMILEEGVPPDQIVALTFTVKACEQMRQRLAEVLSEASPGEAAKANLVNVHTYHGAGHRLVKRFADRLGIGRSGRDLELIDSAQRRRMLRRLVGEDGHMRAMLGQGVDAAAERAADTIDALGDYAVDPKGALALAKKWADRLKANAEGLEGAALAMERAEQTIFEQTARLYDACQKEQRKRGWLTFGDLITWPLALLKNDQLARDLIRGQWRHGVVDEFQDVNQATIALLEELFPPKSRPDLCVVGDDDQAIYAFRGADDRAFARFTQRWPGHATVKLEENYRSEAAVIAVANATIGRAENRYDPTKVVRRPDAKKAAKTAAGASAVAVLTDRFADSGEPIVAMLMRLREENKGLKWSRVAVVARSHLELDRVSMALEAEGIPADRVGGRGNAAVDDPGVKDLLAWCRVLVEPLDFEHARRLLLRPPVGLSGERVLGLLQQFKAARSRVGVEEEAGQVGSAGFIPWVAEQCPDEPAVANLAKIYSEFRATRGIARVGPAVRPVAADRRGARRSAAGAGAREEVGGCGVAAAVRVRSPEAARSAWRPRGVPVVLGRPGSP